MGLKTGQKVYPSDDQNIPKSDNPIMINKHFILLNQEELEAYGITGFRGSIALFLRDMGVGLFCAFIVCAYALFTLVWLAIERHIFDSNTATLIMQIIELIILSFFVAEILLHVTAYGPKIYFSDLSTYVDILLI